MKKVKTLSLLALITSLVACEGGVSSNPPIDSSQKPSSDTSTIISTPSESSSISSSSSSSGISGDFLEEIYENMPSDVQAYYGDVELSLDGRDLKTSLHDTIADHTQIGYDGLWSAYYTTDVDEEGFIVDVYSAFKFIPGTDQNHGQQKNEGDNYNREHVIPQSVFDEKEPMVSDLFHVLPTDSMVNNWRSNYPHAEVRSANRTSTNGTKVGTSATSGVSGSVCEPADEWKGDFARIYFYFATCYQDRLSGFKNYAPLAKNSFPSLSTWAIDLYCRWAQEDPVSDWEIQRNNAVYSIQGNRNPFIDFPELETVIWQDYLD